MVVESKLLSCFFLTDVLCSFRKTEEFGVMDRCLRCSHYKRFMREMEEEEDEMWEEIDREIADFEKRDMSLG